MEQNSKPKILFDMSHTGYGVTGIQQDLRLSMEAVLKSDRYDVSLMWYDVLGYFDLYKFTKSSFKSKLDRVSYNSQMLSVLVGSDSKVSNFLTKFPIFKVYKYISNYWNIYYKSNFPLVKLDRIYNDVIFKKFLVNGMGAGFRKVVNNLDIFLVSMSTHSMFYRMNTTNKKYNDVIVDTKEYDAVFFPTEVPMEISHNSQKIIRLYDLIPIKNPDIVGGGAERSIFQYNSILKCIEQNSIFVAISETVMNEFIEMFNFPKERISYIEPPVGDIFNRTSSTKKDLERLIKLRFCRRLGYTEREIRQFLKVFLGDNDYEYILHVGTIEPRKNIVNLIKSYNTFLSKRKSTDKPVKLILVGALGWLYDDILKIANPFIRNGDIVILEGTATSELSDLYSNAKLFAWLSYAEGWGMPALEAMRCGCPVVSSDIPVHREAQGEAAFYVDPYDNRAAVNAFNFIFDPQNEIIVKEKIELGYMQAEKFSMNNISKKWSDFFDKVIKIK